MKRIIAVVISFIAGAPAFGDSISGHEKHSFDEKSLKIVSDYLTSLDKKSRQKLGSELYYSETQDNQLGTKKSLFEELVKSGRLKADSSLSSSPRTTQCETP
jgi:hypothetical protein